MPSSVNLRLSVLALFLVGLNLRPCLAALPPLLDSIQSATAMKAATASMLTTIPIFLMGILCISGPIILRLKDNVIVTLGILAIGIASALRLILPSEAGLLLTAFIGGSGIAVVQTVLPAVIRRTFNEQSAQVMALYTTAIMAGAVVSSAAAPWLMEISHWTLALGCWSLLALPALTLWAYRFRRSDGVDFAPNHFSHLSPGIGRVIALTIFNGIGTGAYSLVLAWWPPYYTQLGWSPAAAGGSMAIVSLCQVIAGFLVTMIIKRFPDRRPMIFGSCGLVMAGLLVLAFAPLAGSYVAIVCIGVGLGALFPLALIIAMDHANSAREAGSILSIVQGGGYIIAAAFPFMAGLIRDRYQDLSSAWLIMAALVVIMFILASQFRGEPESDALPSNNEGRTSD